MLCFETRGIVAAVGGAVEGVVVATVGGRGDPADVCQHGSGQRATGVSPATALATANGLRLISVTTPDGFIPPGHANMMYLQITAIISNLQWVIEQYLPMHSKFRLCAHVFPCVLPFEVLARAVPLKMVDMLPAMTVPPSRQEAVHARLHATISSMVDLKYRQCIMHPINLDIKYVGIGHFSVSPLPRSAQASPSYRRYARAAAPRTGSDGTMLKTPPHASMRP